MLKKSPPPHPTPIISDGKNNTTLIHLATRHACCWLDFVVFDYDAFFFLEDKCNMSKNCLAQQRDQQHAHLSSFIQFIHVSLDIHESLCSFIDIKSHNFERTINCIKVHNITQHDFVATLVQEIVQGPFFSCVGSHLQNEQYFYHSNWSLLQGWISRWVGHVFDHHNVYCIFKEVTPRSWEAQMIENRNKISLVL